VLAAAETGEDDANDVAEREPGAEHADGEDDAANGREVRARGEVLVVGGLELGVLGGVADQDVDRDQPVALVLLAELRVPVEGGSQRGRGGLGSQQLRREQQTTGSGFDWTWASENSEREMAESGAIARAALGLTTVTALISE
jgi:hypothetical protein